MFPWAPAWPYFTHSFIFGLLGSSTNAENGRVLPQGVAARWGDWVVAALGGAPFIALLFGRMDHCRACRATI